MLCDCFCLGPEAKLEILYCACYYQKIKHVKCKEVAFQVLIVYKQLEDDTKTQDEPFSSSNFYISYNFNI